VQEPKPAQAVVHLAKELREAGTLVYDALGVLLSRAALRWAASRDAPPRGVLEGLEPRADEPFYAMAREAVCSVRLARRHGMGEAGGGVIDEQIGSPGAPFGLISMQREMKMVKWYFGDLLARAAPHRDDPAALAAIFRRECERLTDDPPPSLLVRVLAICPPVGLWQEYREDWNRHSSDAATPRPGQAANSSE
jgi:hypothetical protein